VNVASNQPHSHARQYLLKVSRYDRVASLLIALLVLVGVAVLTLLIVWLTNKIFLHQAAVPVEMVELGTGDSPFSGGAELAGLTDEIVGMETDWEEPSLKDTLEAITQAVSDRAALLDDPSLDDELQSGRGGGSHGDGRGVGSGTGDSGSGTARHWEVRFEGSSLRTYAKQLDHFEIELGVLLPGNRVQYASGLSKPKPDVRIGPADQEQRYYLTWRRGELQQADRELLAKAGIDSRGKLILKFIPDWLEAELMAKEKAHRGLKPSEIRKTVFDVVRGESGYEFRVSEQVAR